MSRRFYQKRKASPARPAGGDNPADDDDEMPDVLQRAQPDSFPKPAEVFNHTPLPFGVLCGIYDELEKATRMKYKHKAETKGDMIEHFFRVRPHLPVIRFGCALIGLRATAVA